MNCSDLELLLAEYVDGTIRGEQKSAIEEHLKECAECAELARDAAAAVAFMERAAVVEAPPELVTRLLFEMTSGASRAEVKPSLARRLFGNVIGSWGERILQPKFTMSIAMTILSFAMLGRFSGIEVRQLKPSDLDPVKVWAAVEDRMQRTWERTVKYYENLRVVYEIQTQLKDWTDQAEVNDTTHDVTHGNNGQKTADQK
jgi:anti-sigma factor RsiW